MEKELSKTLWELFEETGEIGIYNLFTAIDNHDTLGE